METMIAHPHDGIARQDHGRASGKKELEPFRHFEAAMGQVAMEIKCGTDATPEKNWQHDREIRKVKARDQTDCAQDLKSDQNNEYEQLDLFVLKHAAEA